MIHFLHTDDEHPTPATPADEPTEPVAGEPATAAVD